MRPPSRQTPSAHARRSLLLLLVLGLALPAIVASNHVAVRVDGAWTSFRTYASTVGDVLADEGIELAAGDVVVPAPYEPIENGTTIRILRTIEVSLVIDGEPERRVRGTFRSVDGLLDTVGITAREDLVITPGERTALADGDVVTVRTPKTVTVHVDGETHTTETQITRLDLLLVDLGIEVRDADLVDPPLETPVDRDLELTIRRVETDEHVEEIVLDFATVRRTTDALFEGQSRVVQSGESGLRVDTYRLTIVDGEETERELVSEEVVREPVDRIVEVGTRKRPTVSVDDTSVWYKLAQCESGGNWYIDSKFDGGLQFHPDTWRRYKPADYPDYAYQATPEQQIVVGKRVQRAQGWGAWPSCSLKLGLR